jgi:RNA recognition motif-containing protein
MNKIFVGNLSFSISESALEMFIREFGIEVEEIRIIRDRYTGRSRGFGFVELRENQDLDEAISQLHGRSLEGRDLRVDRANERSRGGSAGGRGDSYGDRPRRY